MHLPPGSMCGMDLLGGRTLPVACDVDTEWIMSSLGNTSIGHDIGLKNRCYFHLSAFWLVFGYYLDLSCCFVGQY